MVLGLLQDAVANLNKANHALEVSERSNAELRRENFDLWLTAIERDQLAAKYERLAAELQNRDADHAWRINEANCVNLAQELTINDLQGKLDKCMSEIESLKQSLHMATNTPAVSTIDNTSDLEELTDTTSLISTDDDSSDVTDIAIDAPTDADSAVTTPVITSPVVPTPDFASRLGLCLPPFCRMVNARQGLPGVIYDQSGAEVTSKRLLAVVKPFIFVDLDLMRNIYYAMYGCRLISDDIGPYQLVQTLAILDGFKQWSRQLSGEDSASLAGLSFLQRYSCEPRVLAQSLHQQLGLVQDKSAVVLGPVLCFTLVTLCGTRVDRMTGQLLDKVFTAATRIKIQLLWVATASGTKQMSKDDICQTVKDWVQGLGELIAMDSDIEQSLDRARKCNGEYTRRCVATSDSSIGNVASEMLRTGEHFSQMLLGIRDDQLKALCRKLVHVVDSGTSPHIKDSLRRVASELQHQPCSP
ncbi:hypothetical protein FBU31_004452 [Coemansia sp. 'formosensis']|nr:hypothetical protein FBU31_004452 [Coemansia sp. 'formosensis']